MNRTLQKIDETPWRWRIAGILSIVLAFRFTMWGLPFLFRWGENIFWLVPPIGVWLGMTTNPWFWPVVVVLSPLFLFVGAYAGFVWWAVLGYREASDL